MKPRHTLVALSLACAWAQADAVPRAVRLMDEGRIEEARKILQEELRKNSKDEDANALLGKIAFDRKEYAEAVTRFGRAVGSLRRNPLLAVSYAEALAQTGSAAQAREVIGRVQAGNAAAQFECGLVLARMGDFDAATQHFRQAAQAGYPDAEVVGYNLALAQARAGRFRESAGTLEAMRRRGSNSGDVLNLLGQAYLELGEAEQSLGVLRRAIRLHPSDDRNYITVGKLAVERDMMAVGLEVLDQGVRVLPDSFGLRMQRAYLRLSRGEYGAAETDYRYALRLEPQSESARTGLALVFMQNGRNSEAESLLREVVDRRPSNAFVLYLLADLLTREGEENQAVALLEKAVHADASLAAARANLGKLYLKRNQVAAATRELEEASRLDPEDSAAFYQLALAYRRSGEAEKAERALATVQRLNEEQRKLGNALFTTRRFQKARKGALSAE